MEKKRYNRRFKYISIPLYKEGGYILSDTIFFQCNMNAASTYIYNAIKFKKKLIESAPICKRFSRLRKMSKFSEIAKNKIKELIEKDSSISSSEIKDVTGYSWPIINRYYMTFKKIYR